jgi:hypothetical protein
LPRLTLSGFGYPTEFSKAAAKDWIAAQMDQPRTMDSITTAINAAAATSRGLVPCAADRLRSSNIPSVPIRNLL